MMHGYIHARAVAPHTSLTAEGLSSAGTMMTRWSRTRCVISASTSITGGRETSTAVVGAVGDDVLLLGPIKIPM